MATMYYNRIKVVLMEKKRTAKQLAQHLEVDAGTVSRWCQNKNQPSISMLYRIATYLDVQSAALLNKII
ncbi:helix-turn-helix transcriptional regulator [Chitinophaga niabensis]|uniref:Helix-turn-helix n=1 Tax=Chitinophaga niabensis TaxID=536979 RepID=A0A1N6EAH4_9BACT|nr:helix-turn-helix transcriptional regulator [Chitinophaga niabensis]SIN79917.1 Helix-turn-helix [Chitinophaga niabensis]